MTSFQKSIEREIEKAAEKQGISKEQMLEETRRFIRGVEDRRKKREREQWLEDNPIP